MSSEDRPIHPAVIGAAFMGGPFGLHGLYARVDEARNVDEPIPGAPDLAERHVAVVGHFEDGKGQGRRKGTIQGYFGWALYHHSVSGQLEGWLSGIEVFEARRGGMIDFVRAGLEALGRFRARRVRCVADRVGAYALARLGFGFDPDRLRGFGHDGKGVGSGGERLWVRPDAVDPAVTLAELIIDAAFWDERIDQHEAGLLRPLALRSPAAMASLPNGDLARRLLVNSRWPGSIELGLEQRWSTDRGTGRPVARFLRAPVPARPLGG